MAKVVQGLFGGGSDAGGDNGASERMARLQEDQAARQEAERNRLSERDAARQRVIAGGGLRGLLSFVEDGGLKKRLGG